MDGSSSYPAPAAGRDWLPRTQPPVGGDGSSLPGKDGAPGVTDASATATTGIPGSDASASVTLAGTILDFSFTIPRGDQGIQGEPGPRGDQGIQGEPGKDGTNADCSGYLPIGDKGASLRIRDGDDFRNVKVFAMEAPQFWLLDILTVNGTDEVEIDPVFLQIIEPDSLRVVSCHVPGPVHSFATIKDHRVRVVRQSWPHWISEAEAAPATVTLAALRRLTGDVRFPPATDFEVACNAEFIQRCRGELPPPATACGPCCG